MAVEASIQTPNRNSKKWQESRATKLKRGTLQGLNSQPLSFNRSTIIISTINHSGKLRDIRTGAPSFSHKRHITFNQRFSSQLPRRHFRFMITSLSLLSAKPNSSPAITRSFSSTLPATFACAPVDQSSFLPSRRSGLRRRQAPRFYKRLGRSR